MASETANSHTGGCLCGRVSYRLSGAIEFPHVCSCRMCQSWSGAPLVGWIEVLRTDIAVEGEVPVTYRSSPSTVRGFCGTCGSSIFAADDGSDSISITIGSLAAGHAIEPRSHSFADTAPAWLAAPPWRQRE